jgi:hypothetical protein
MHVLGILYLCLMAGALLSLGDVVGAWLFDRRRRRES